MKQTMPLTPKKSLIRSLVSTKKRQIALFGAALLIIASSSLFYARHNNSTSEASAQSLTLYYQDGKTVLWQTGQEAGPAKQFIEQVKSQLQVKYGADYQNKGEWRVTTTLQESLQKKAQEQLQAQDTNLATYNISDTLLIAEDVTNGQIVSWASNSRDPAARQKPQAKVMAGTLAMPFNYIAYLEKNSGDTTTMFDDKQIALPGYPCLNHAKPKEGGNCLFNLDYQYKGPLTLRQALGGLRNVPAAQAATAVSAQKMTQTMNIMGADSACYQEASSTQATSCYTAASFGDGLFLTPHRLVQAYATLANSGSKLPQQVFTKTSLNNKDYFTAGASRAEQVIRIETAQAITSVLTDPEASFLIKKDAFTTAGGRKAAVFSGYVQDGTGSSSIEYTPTYAVGVWVTGNGKLNGPYQQDGVLPLASNWLNSAEEQ